MSTSLFDAVSIGPASRFAHQDEENLLAASTIELAGLRFSIILTARWEAAACDDLERRNELRAELEDLRRQYSQKIDEIAMSSGIQNAIDAKEKVERAVAIPLGMDLSIEPDRDGNYLI